MTAAQAAETTRSGARLWIFRGLILGGAVLMLVSWFMPWWAAQINGLPGKDHLVMRPWGVEVVAEVKAYADKSLYSMPAFIAPFMWLYLGLCMVALTVSLFVEKQITLGRFKFSLPQVLIGIVGLSYLIAVISAFAIAQLKSADSGVHFLGSSMVRNALTGGKVKITGALELGYWLAVGAGPVLVALALLRNFIVGRAKT